MISGEVPEDSVPVLVGIQGWVTGEVYILKDGDTVVLGRSRSCDISFRRIGAYLDRPPAERDADHDFNTVSRRHLKLTVINKQVTIEDLSTNGSYCNDEAIDGKIEISASSEDETSIRLGTRETLRLELATPGRLAELKERAGDQAQVDVPDAPANEPEARTAEAQPGASNADDSNNASIGETSDETADKLQDDSPKKAEEDSSVQS